MDSEPLWTGPSDAVQTRVVGAAALAVRVELVDPGTSAADAPAPVPGAAAAAAAEPAIYSRAAWGADESLRSRNPGCGTPAYAPTVKAGFVHHTDGTNDYTAAQVPAILRGIYAYHVLGHGWCDIGYNFLVDRFGRVWEGRYGGTTRAVIGAHTGGFNTDSFGAAMIGDFTSVSPPAALQSALARLLAWKLSLPYADPAGATVLTSAGGPDTAHPAGQAVRVAVISGHRDVDLTSCPGTYGYAALPGIRRAALAATGQGLLAPVIAYRQLAPGAVPAATFAAGMLQPAAWSFTVRDAAGAVVRAYAGTGAAIGGSWDGRTAAGAAVAPGTYTLTLASGTARPYAVTAIVRSGGDLAVLGGPAGSPVGVTMLPSTTGYATAVAQTSVLTPSDPQNWTYAIAPFTAPGARDLVAVHETGTASGRVEVHVLSAASGYRTYVAHLATALGAVDPAQWDFGVAPFQQDAAADLYAVRLGGGSAGRVELHVLSRATDYHAFSMHAVTALGPVDPAQWRMLVGDQAGAGDLTAVRLLGGAGGQVEVHRLSAASRWQAYTLHAATPLASPAGTQQYALSLADQNADGIDDLDLVLLGDTGSGRVELHVLSGATSFHLWALHRATGLDALDPAGRTAAVLR